MTNTSKQKRKEMMDFLETLKTHHKDEEILRIINEIALSINEKKYGLVWEKHLENVFERIKEEIPVFSELEDKKIISNNDSEFNYVLEGDNLHSLHLLRKTHREKIDFIYIDPPYNTGNKDFFYHDSYVAKDDGFRHSKWLSFMENRLTLAKDLLSEQGTIFISIDENEHAQLKLLCDEIFGEDNLLCDFIWESSGNTDNQAIVTHVHEYILAYTKNINRFHYNKIVDPNVPEDSKIKRNFVENSSIKNGVKNPASTVLLPIGFPCSAKKAHLDKHKNAGAFIEEVENQKKYIDRNMKSKYKVSYPVRKDDLVVDNYKVVKPIEVYSGWSNKAKLLKFIKNDCKPVIEGDIKYYFYLTNTGAIYYKKEGRESHYVSSILRNVGTSERNKYILEKMGITFSFPKPKELIKYLMKFITKKDSIVLDFFAGSGTTGHALLELNDEDKGARKYILCTNDENNIANDVTYKRLKYLQDDYPHNLKYYKTDFISKRVTDEESTLKGYLMKYIKALLELEHHLEVDQQKNIFIQDEEVVFSAIEKASENANIFYNSDILLDSNEVNIANEKSIRFIEIPEYYFTNELIEVGEL